MLENSFSSTSSSKLIDINEELLHLEYNPILKNVPNVKERFWDMFIVDILINNNDRNNGNWGVLYSDNQYILAPVFDNGAAFSTKLPDYKLEDYLNNPEKMEKSINGCATTYALNGKIIKAQNIANADFLYTNSYFVDAVKRIVPIIQSKKREIIELIQNIPTECDGISICSDIRKEFYCKTLSMRVDEFLTPALTKAQNIAQNSQNEILNHSKPQRRR
jgi:hypothetical protein